MKTMPKDPAASRKDRLIHEHIHDPYQSRRKLEEPTVCPQCSAVYRQGRWQWAESWPLDSHQKTCPACQRMADDCPAGELTIRGAYLRDHKQEILNLIQHEEGDEKSLHPLHRIMKQTEGPDTLVIQTTDLHLPHRLGEALHNAHHGQLDLHYDEEGYFLRVHWSRDD